MNEDDIKHECEGLTLDEYLARKRATCQYAVVITTDGDRPYHDALVKLTEQQLYELNDLWIKRYYDFQDRRAVEAKTKEREKITAAIKQRHSAAKGRSL